MTGHVIRKNQPHDVKAAAAQAATLVSRQTCEGCAHLRALRPMCMDESSPHFRKPRESFNDRCGWYAVAGVKQAVRA